MEAETLPPGAERDELESKVRRTKPKQPPTWSVGCALLSFSHQNRWNHFENKKARRMGVTAGQFGSRIGLRLSIPFRAIQCETPGVRSEPRRL